jgi:asparagine synthase (glutamine-hydrolysing)
VCGIAAIFDKTGGAEGIAECLDAIEAATRHRGPDGSGRHVELGWGFLAVRLAIVDVQSGQQPIYSEDGRLGIVYNGEVYNHEELRRELEAKGWRFRTHSDTEVVLRAFEAYGTEAFPRLNGMFAFCIWDAQRREAYVVRDRLGIKPLYVYEDARRLICCSEVKGIAAIGDVELTLDPLGVQDYLLYRYVQAPHTVFRKVRSLEAGTFLRIREGHATQHRYWDLGCPAGSTPSEPGDAASRLREHLRRAVGAQLMGEVPIGVLLSGGVDSSTIAHYVQSVGANLSTFNIGFPEMNEFRYSRAVAGQLGLKHIEVVTTVDELVDMADDVIVALDHPMADPACLPLYRLAQELRRHVTVVLSGEGGDELFAGYPQYGRVLGAQLAYRERFRAFLEESFYFLNYETFLARSDLPLTTWRYWKYFEERPTLDGMLAFDLKTWLPENLLMKADKILMAHSLEGRFPFLDHELLEYAAGLPAEYKLGPGGVSKWLLKEAMRPHLPTSVVDRPKMGFSVPVPSLLAKMRDRVTAAVEWAEASEVPEVLRLDRVRATVNEYFTRGAGSALQVWSLFVLLSWLQIAVPEYRLRGRDAAGRDSSAVQVEPPAR